MVVIALVGVIGVAALLAFVYLFSGDDDTPVELTSADTGSTLRIEADAEFVIRLESNATTGYKWEIEDLDQGIVTVVGTSYIAPENGSVGEGGQEEWRFRAVTEGTSVVALKYWQPWAGDDSIAERFELALVVDD